MKKTLQFGALAGAAALVLAGCASAAPPASAPADSAAQTAPDGPRVAVGYEGGVLVLGGEDYENLGEFASEDFIRLNSAGDGRHVMVTTSKGFQLLDVQKPELTELVVPAAAAGHVVSHAGKTVLYDDATSDTTIFDSAELAKTGDALPKAEVVPGVTAHHGVSVELEDGTLLTTVGDESGRTGIRVLDEDRTEIASNDECPGVHGEGTAKDEVVVFGCENGALVVKDGEIAKLTSPDEYGRMGNAYVSESSPLVVMDYKDDPDAEGYLLRNITLIDTEANTLEKVALPDGVEYTYRGVGRGPDDEAVLIGTDGQLHSIDPATGEITGSLPVVDPWEGPAEWQDPHPSVKVAGSLAYVTDPADSELVVVDLETDEIVHTVALDHVPNEIAVVG
ncbi:zinc metallochaperone AztD [Microbacterium sp. KSW4-11]|uniref:Zinc metallochaperone AztD n=1 Tax=Microbacterium gawkjiense TaxID=3067309 RepID=A0ABU3G733_9MICO|nr:zinc metallochaperone AztD [Microbacterium sp. KSW4-11]MDT3315619.1 zinc metallochaperone AztD [Microbacterium sp. KSW4-11]